MMKIEIDAHDIDKIMLLLPSVPGKAKSSLKGALRRSGTALRTTISRGIRAESFLKARDVRAALGNLQMEETDDGLTAEFRVASRPIPADHYRLRPNRITARRGMRSISWPLTRYQVGPGEPLILPETGELSNAFILKASRGRTYVQHTRGGHDLHRVYGPSVQYFSVFDRVQEPAFKRALEIFEKRLIHEAERWL